MFNPTLWEIAGTVILGIFIGAYINWDLKFMTEERGEEYAAKHWSLAVLHLHTDIFYRFWSDLFSKKDEGEDISKFLDEQTKKEEEMRK